MRQKLDVHPHVFPGLSSPAPSGICNHAGVFQSALSLCVLYLVERHPLYTTHCLCNASFFYLRVCMSSPVEHTAAALGGLTTRTLGTDVVTEFVLFCTRRSMQPRLTVCLDVHP